MDSNWNRYCGWMTAQSGIPNPGEDDIPNPDEDDALPTPRGERERDDDSLE